MFVATNLHASGESQVRQFLKSLPCDSIERHWSSLRCIPDQITKKSLNLIVVEMVRMNMLGYKLGDVVPEWRCDLYCSL